MPESNRLQEAELNQLYYYNRTALGTGARRPHLFAVGLLILRVQIRQTLNTRLEAILYTLIIPSDPGHYVWYSWGQLGIPKNPVVRVADILMHP